MAVVEAGLYLVHQGGGGSSIPSITTVSARAECLRGGVATAALPVPARCPLPPMVGTGSRRRVPWTHPGNDRGNGMTNDEREANRLVELRRIITIRSLQGDEPQAECHRDTLENWLSEGTYGAARCSYAGNG